MSQVDTPALIVELDALERNLRHMAEVAGRTGIKLRPHAKSHKNAQIAHRQMALGAIGICCQKVSEAEALVQAGIPDVYVSNEVVGERKLSRLAALARQARVAVAVDAHENVEPLDQAAGAAGARLDVMVDIDVGDARTGVPPGAEAARLASRIASSAHLHFRGLHAYRSVAQHAQTPDARRCLAEEAAGLIETTRRALTESGLPCDVVSGGGTGTYDIEGELGALTELQAGSYVFMDARYLAIEGAGGAPFRDFEQSLFLLSTVMSRSAPSRLMLDAGVKAVEVGSGPPIFADHDSLRFDRADDEHGRVTVLGGAGPGLGEKLRLIPANCDPTVNLHDWLVGVRDGRVETLWPVTARGAVH